MRNFEHEEEIIRRIREHAAKIEAQELEQLKREMAVLKEKNREVEDKYYSLKFYVGLVCFIILMGVMEALLR